MMASRMTAWVRRLGWVLIPALVLALSAWVPNALGIDPGFWPVLPSLLATFLIGARVRERWWVKAMPVVIVAVCVIAAVLLVGQVVVGLSRDPGSNPNQGLGFLLFAIPIFAVVVGGLYALAAASGVWWGRRRGEADPAPPVVDRQ